MMNLYLLFVLQTFLVLCCAQEVKVAPKLYSRKAELDSLYLYPTGLDFKPIGGLTTLIHVTYPCAVFVHYQLTVYHSSTGHDFWTKLLVNDMNAGALLRTGTQRYKTATGFWMGNLNPGKYEFVVYYKTSKGVFISAGTDYQTAVLQVMTFDGVAAVSDGIKCFPEQTQLNQYNNSGPIRNLETLLYSPSHTIFLFAYQFSLEHQASPTWFVSKSHVDYQYEESTTGCTGAMYANHHSLLFKSLYSGIHYSGVIYRTRYYTEFTDCKYKYLGNENLYSLYLPSGCHIQSVYPTSSVFLSTSWQDTDLSYSLSISSVHHVMVRYQFSSSTRGPSYVVTRLAINSVPQKQTAAIIGLAACNNNFGFWQGSLPNGKHQITVQHSSSSSHYYRPSSDSLNRAMDIIYCQ